MSDTKDRQTNTLDVRAASLNQWAIACLRARDLEVGEDFRIRSASDDASFRRYFRGEAGSSSFIFVDAPPAKEDSETFARVAKLLLSSGLHVPTVFETDFESGFMMLSDLGDRSYFDALLEDRDIESLYQESFDAILKMQTIDKLDGLPAYDEALLRSEMALFVDWFLPGQLKLDISDSEKKLLKSVFDKLVESALGQPQVFVHRDYHCRNLMVVPDGPGIIDFQDAVVGPVTYDLVSLLKDCYHRFDRESIERWVRGVLRATLDSEITTDGSEETFLGWFDLMGMQRHIKCAGIFSRLNLRDGKQRYLADIPLVIDYVCEASELYSEFSSFSDWLRERVHPRVNNLFREETS